MDIPPFKKFKKKMAVSIQFEEPNGEPKGELIKLHLNRWTKSKGTHLELIGATDGDVKKGATYVMRFKGTPWRGTFDKITDNEGMKTFTFAAIIADREFWA